MKKIFLPIIFIFFCVSLLSADGYSINSKAKKVVSEIKTFNWNPEQGWFEGPTTKIIVEKYDEKGRLVSEELFYQQMILIEKTIFIYEGDVIKKTTTNHENMLIRTSHVKRDGNMVTETVKRADGSQLFKIVSQIDSNGRIAELYRYNEESELVFCNVYVYSDKGDVSSISLFNPDGTFAVLVTINYTSFDDKGNWLVRSEYYTYADVWRRPRDYVYRTIEY